MSSEFEDLYREVILDHYKNPRNYGLLEPNDAGFTRARGAAVDSLIGAQLVVQLNPMFPEVAQLQSEQEADGTYLPHVEWANLQYQFTPDFSIRVGRAVLPVFLLTATRKVGYTYPWRRLEAMAQLYTRVNS